MTRHLIVTLFESRRSCARAAIEVDIEMKEMTSFLIIAAAAAMVTGDMLLPVAMPHIPYLARAGQTRAQEMTTGEQMPEQGATCLCTLLEGMLPE